MLMDDEAYDKIARSDCFVCRIVAGIPLIPNPIIIYEDARVIAFFNQFPTQEGYTIVCPKRHAERFESDLSVEAWLHLQGVVQQVARAISDTTGAIRMYIASLGSPERNAHLHIHVCPCPSGTPFEEQQGEAMRMKDGRYLEISEERSAELAQQIRQRLTLV